MEAATVSHQPAAGVRPPGTSFLSWYGCSLHIDGLGCNLSSVLPAAFGFSVLLDELGDQCGPSGLMGGAKTTTGIAMKELMKRDQLIPVGI